MTDLVYRARRGAVWHWPHPTRPGVSACTATPLDPDRHLDPVSVDMRDRCTGHGCGQRWHVWLVRTVHAALAETAERFHAELTRRGGGVIPLCERCDRVIDLDCPCYWRLPEVERRRVHARVSRAHRAALRRAAGLPEIERKWAA